MRACTQTTATRTHAPMPPLQVAVANMPTGQQRRYQSSSAGFGMCMDIVSGQTHNGAQLIQTACGECRGRWGRERERRLGVRFV